VIGKKDILIFNCLRIFQIDKHTSIHTIRARHIDHCFSHPIMYNFLILCGK
jgi:hypothetical protein